MDLKEFIKYFESLTTAKAEFCNKATAHQQKINADRAPARRWNDAVVAVQVEKMWLEVVEKLYDNIKNTITKSQDPVEWHQRLEAEDFMDEVDDSIRGIELDGEEE
ncbi:hypothetical protein [Lapidilactobacillus bayanensis]|uniref:hypothetical protein n=1 Tax=Lapidilactobacillus bayanensis TaxID=2485998 RepID=UPI000F7AE4C3|nr:hypothetical protein [Lapidilactobacillus bayanensis]